MLWVIRLTSLLAACFAAAVALERRAVAAVRAWTFALAVRRAQRARPYPTPRERQEEEAWAQAYGLARGQRATVFVAPSTFTVGVMARIAVQPAPGAFIAGQRQDTSPLAALRVAGLTLAFSALLALVSGCVLTLAAPGAALAALGTLVSGGVALLDLTERLPGLASGAVTNDGLILALAVIPGMVLLMRSLRARLASGSAREA